MPLGKTEGKVRRLSLHIVEGTAQLNYSVLRQNTLDEVDPPLDRPRTTRIHQSQSIHHDAKTYTLDTWPAHKYYCLVYSKCVLNSITAKTFPYSYRCPDDDDENQSDITLDNIDLFSS